jgi:hypothetical protein
MTNVGAEFHVTNARFGKQVHIKIWCNIQPTSADLGPGGLDYVEEETQTCVRHTKSTHGRTCTACVFARSRNGLKQVWANNKQVNLRVTTVPSIPRDAQHSKPTSPWPWSVEMIHLPFLLPSVFSTALHLVKYVAQRVKDTVLLLDATTACPG